MSPWTGGAVTVKLTYRYSGPEEIRVRATHHEDAVVVPPDGWRRLVGMRGYNGPTRVSWTFRPNEERVQFYRFRQMYDGITAGRHSLTLRWHIQLADGDEPFIAQAGDTITLNVEKSSPEAVDRFRQFIRQTLSERPSDDQENLVDAICRSFDGATDPEVLKLLFELLDESAVPEQEQSLLLFGFSRYRMFDDSKELSLAQQGNLVRAACDYLKRPYPRSAIDVISQMTRRRAPVGFVAAIRPRLDRLHPLVRAACPASFPELRTPDRTRTVPGGLSHLYPAPNSASVERLLADLDAPTFRTRERGHAALRSMGRPVLPFLQGEARAPRSPEVGARVQSLMEQVERDDASGAQPLEAAVLRHLKVAGGGWGAAAIGAIAGNPADRWVVREARSIRNHGE